MIRVSLILFFFIAVCNSYAQQKFIDSLKQIVNQSEENEAKINALAYLGNNTSNFLDAVNYAKQGLLLAKEKNDKKGQANCNLVLSGLYGGMGYSNESIQYALNALVGYQELEDNTGIASTHLLLQGNYRDAEDFTNALIHESEGEKIAGANNVKGKFLFPNHRLAPLFLAETAQTYILKNQPDSALIYVQKSIQENELFDGTSWEFPIYLLAVVQQMKGDYLQSLESYRSALHLAKIQTDNAHDTLQIYSGMSTLFKKAGQLDSSVYYAQIVMICWKPEISEKKNLLEAVNNLFETYKLKGQKDSTLKYLELNYHLRESFFSTEKEKQIQETTFKAQLQQQAVLAEQAKDKNQLQLLMFTSGILALLIISGLLIRNSRHNKKAKMKIEKAYTDLKATQAQLIQSEKMASLGELTAGIAHEIQNPLNFVNNFSEVNKELLTEMNEEIAKGNFNEVTGIAKDVIDNQEKINFHGKRADAIVKGMLQHSRSSSGVKEPTDINALADEYLRLAYHGLRAKDNSFNATMKTDFDESIGKINIIPRDIGRVILNLLTNAFYAVNDKKRTAGDEYEPTVTISTKRSPLPRRGAGGEVLITVKDNGGGIPEKVLDKIFQPFFTTKPTGQGTGLGLSLAYDIVKAHGGEIKVETIEGKGTIFIIHLPISA